MLYTLIGKDGEDIDEKEGLEVGINLARLKPLISVPESQLVESDDRRLKPRQAQLLA
jgi:hypothetical protein